MVEKMRRRKSDLARKTILAFAASELSKGSMHFSAKCFCSETLFVRLDSA